MKRPQRARLISCFLATALGAVALAWPTPAMAAPNDPYYSRQWHHARIGTPTAWKTTTGKGITIAIVDTGVERRHEDLARNMSRAQYDSVNNDNRADDLQGHGTAVAGAAAAVMNNRRGLVGVAPSAKIMAVRAFSAKAGADPDDVSGGIMWAADHGADVINLSLGTSSTSPLNVAVDIAPVTYAVAQGSLVIAAAGNSSEPQCFTPAISPGALCVGATDNRDALARFSNYGVRLDIVAPGVGIWTTNRSFYGPSNGTSLASPIVAGVGALLMSMGANNILAAAILRASAKDLGLPGYDLTYGFGRLDAKAAVALCKQIC